MPDDLLFDPRLRPLNARIVEAVLDSTAPFVADPKADILISASLLAAICEVARRHVPQE
jgi:hypothetical protein